MVQHVVLFIHVDVQRVTESGGTGGFGHLPWPSPWMRVLWGAVCSTGAHGVGYFIFAFPRVVCVPVKPSGCSGREAAQEYTLYLSRQRMELTGQGCKDQRTAVSIALAF